MATANGGMATGDQASPAKKNRYIPPSLTQNIPPKARVYFVFSNEFELICFPRWSSVTIKVGMVGDSAIGKTSLMVKYVEGAFDEDYIQTLGLSPHLLFPT
jgi:hypothetical protein